MGQYADGDSKVVMLTRGDRLLTVAIGDVIEKTYRVDSLKAGVLTFVYLPLDIKQTLNTGVTQ
jgi:hypothetical protein